jgi:hypothetical protein
MNTYWKSEVPSTAFLEGDVYFKKLPHKTAVLSFSFETESGVANIELRFFGIEFFSCVYRSARHANDLLGYDCVVQLENTPELDQVIAGRRSNLLPEERFKHFVFQFDGGAKYGFVCLSFEAVRTETT